MSTTRIKLNVEDALNAFTGYSLAFIDTSTVHIWVKSKAHYSGFTTRQLALMLSYGTPTITARPFMHLYVATREQFVRHVIARNVQISKSITNANQKRVKLHSLFVTADWARIGEEVAQDVRRWLFDGSVLRAFAPNAPATLRKKGEDKPPLVDYGVLADSISWSIIRREYKPATKC